MLKIGYSLVHIATSVEVKRFHDTVLDGNGRPQLMFIIPGTADAVHCPEIGGRYGAFKFVECWYDDAPPSPLHAPIGERGEFNGEKYIVTRLYPVAPNLAPPRDVLAELDTFRARLDIAEAMLRNMKPG